MPMATTIPCENPFDQGSEPRPGPSVPAPSLLVVTNESALETETQNVMGLGLI